jgi:branched-chain amino acid transport system substrate-binding protein
MKKALLAALAVLGLSVAAAASAGAPASSARPYATASPAAAERALIRCGRTRTIGVAAPLTGLAASLGQQQIKWVRFFVNRWNRAHPRGRLRIVSGDTQLPDTAQAIQVAERLSSNARVLAVVGPAGSQEVQVSSAPFRTAGLGYVSGSATRTSLTNDGTRRGRFFRVVPNDDQQGPRVVQHMRRVLNATRIVVVDAQNSYSTGLSDFVEQALKAQSGVTVQRESVDEANVTDFSSLVARIPANTQVVYVPWQVAPKAQLFGQQLRAGGRNATLFGSDGLFDPDTFKIPGSLVSFFPLDLRSAQITAYKRTHGGKSDLFGLPSYVAAEVVARAIDKACRNGTATRLEVRRNIAQTNIPKRQSLLGFQIRFAPRLAAPLGPGDMQRPADFGIYRINPQGAYVRIA